MRIRTLNMQDVSFKLDVEQDDHEVRGNAMASGDDALDKEVEDEILARLNAGDVWAWAYVRVIATYKNFKGSEGLGGCSYANQHDFEHGGYYEQMREDALADLNKTIGAIASNIPWDEGA